MTTPTPSSYTLEQAQQDIAALRYQLALQGDFVSTVADKALLLYAPDAHAIPRGPSSWSFEDGTVDGWGALNGAVTNSTVSASGWPTDGTHSLLLTANGSGAPQAFGPGGLSGIPTQPGDPVVFSADIYCPAAQTNIYAQISWYDDTGGFISGVGSTHASFTAGQVQTLAVNGAAPDLCAYFAVAFGCTNTLASGQLIYGDNIRVQGNLAIAASPGGGTDSVSNPYPAGVTTFGVTGGGTATLNNGNLTFGQTSPPAGSAGGGVFPPNSLNGNVEIQSGIAGGSDTIAAMVLQSATRAGGTQQAVTDRLVAWAPGAVHIAAETWHNLTGLIAGWTVGTARYKLLADSGLVLIEIVNLVPPASPPVNATKIWPASSLPAAYQPAVTTPRHIAYHTGSGGTETPALEVETDGSIEVYGVGSTSVSRMDLSIILSTV